MATSKPRPVVVSLNVEGFGGQDIETEKIDRAEWDALSVADRNELLDVMAADHAANYVAWGWDIYNPDDLAATKEEQ